MEVCSESKCLRVSDITILGILCSTLDDVFDPFVAGLGLNFLARLLNMPVLAYDAWPD